YHSGDREAYGRITKRGSGELRAMLCEAAHHASRPTHPLHPYFAVLCAKRGYKMATIAVAHRLARITFAMLRDGTDFDVGKLNIEEGRAHDHPPLPAEAGGRGAAVGTAGTGGDHCAPHSRAST